MCEIGMEQYDPLQPPDSHNIHAPNVHDFPSQMGVRAPTEAKQFY